MKEKKWKNRAVIPYIILGVLTVFFCWLFVGKYGVFGSKVDWLSQHSVFPDYFRQQFYETGELFPEFTANIGGGQNIYHFAYYGLYSPVILLSYLLPSVKMSSYIMAASVLNLALSVMLLYRWLLKKGISARTAFLTAVYFLLAGPVIFHSYGHIMFVNYMPFLILALSGVDAYFEQKKISLYICAVWLMILTSFYFSIGGMLVLVLYGIHRYVQQKEQSGSRIGAVGFLKDGVRFLMPMTASVMMSGFLLVPAAMALAGRENVKPEVLLSSLFIPDFEISRILYNPYGIGLTSLVITALLTGAAFGKWSDRLLYISCLLVLTVPFFAYALNGGLYVRDKVMIPFLPLLCYLTAHYLEKQKQEEISYAAGGIPFLLTILFVYLGRGHAGKYWKWMLLDSIVMAVWFFAAFYRRRQTRSGRVHALLVISAGFLALYGTVLHRNADRMTEQEFYNKITDTGIERAVSEIVDNEPGFYRMEQSGTDREKEANMNRVWDMGQYITSVYSSAYNKEYQKFRTETFKLEQPLRNFLMQPSVKNPVFQKFMGVKYILSERELPECEVYKTIGNINIYKNENVSPIAYATDRVISEKEYLKLEYPYNQMALLNGAVVREEKTESDLETQIAEVKLSETEYRIRSGRIVKIPIAEAEENDILFLRCKVKNNRSSKDVGVWLEDSRNKLTSKNHIYYNENTEFHYAVALEKGQREVKLKFGKGDYEITDMECYIGNPGTHGKELYQSEFMADKNRIKGNQIAGTIDAAGDGYFITTIPYDSSFEVKIDGKKAAYEKVNTAFLGMKIGKGSHEIEIIYHAPGVELGKMMSLAGIILFILLKKLPVKE